MGSAIFHDPSFRHLLAYKHCQENANASQQGFKQFGKRGLVPPNYHRHPAGFRKIAPEEFRQIKKLRRVWTTLQGRDICQDSFPSQPGQHELDFSPSGCHFTQRQVAFACEKHQLLFWTWNHSMDHGLKIMVIRLGMV